MAGFPLLTDNHVRQPIIKALRARGWDVVRAVIPDVERVRGTLRDEALPAFD